MQIWIEDGQWLRFQYITMFSGVIEASITFADYDVAPLGWSSVLEPLNAPFYA